MQELFYTSSDKIDWIYSTIEYRNRVDLAKGKSKIGICFSEELCKEKFEPMHIVLFSCLVDDLRKKGYRIGLDFQNQELNDFVWNDIKVGKYWNENPTHHVPSSTPSRFNLWRIIDEQKDAYAISVCEYFKNLHKGKDFSGFQTALNELYYNVFDHADADGDAFSYIAYDEIKCTLSVAVCDFGKGIAKTLRDTHPEYDSDDVALQAAIENGVTSQSKSHNAGMGLYNIVGMLQGNDYLRIISNKSLLICMGDQKKIVTLQNNFEGTLIYLRLSMNSFEDEEILESFEF